MFNINLTYLLKILLPPILRKERQRSWLRLITSQLQRIYNEFVAIRTLWKYYINFTVQVCYLEKKINHFFNTQSIFISDGIFIQSLFIYNENETLKKNMFIYNENENIPVFLNNLSEMNNEIDYYINIPSSVDKLQVINIVEKYNLYTKRYKIKKF